jgi:outer membrane protein insertion porin family
MPSGRAGTRAAAALCALALLAAPLRAHGAAAEEPRRVAAVIFLPSDRVGPYALADMVPARAGVPYTPELLERSLRLLRGTGLFAEAHGEAQEAAGGPRLFFHLTPLPLVKDVRIRGNFLILDRDLIPVLRLRPAEPFSEEVLRGDLERLRRHYEEAGFADTRVSEERRRERDEVTVTYRIREGRPEVVGAIAVTGNAAVPTREVLDAFSLGRYTFFQAAALQKALEGLRDFYQARGYLDARVDASTEFGPGEIPLRTILANPIKGLLTLGPEGYRMAKITLLISEGRRYEASFTGAKAFGEGTLRGLVTFKRAGFFDEEEVAASRERLLEHYHEHGYYLVEIEAQADYEAGRVVFAIRENAPVTVAAVRFRGVTHFTEEWLRARLDVQAAGPEARGLLRAADLERDRARLRAWYRDAGFTRAEVPAPEVWPDALPGGAEVTFTVREGPRTLVRSVSFDGAVGIAAAKLREAAGIAAGDPLREDAPPRAAERVRALYEREGYPRCTVAARVDYSADLTAADLRFVVVQGRPQRLGTIAVTGNGKTSRRVILRELPLHPDEPFDPGGLDAGRTKLYDLGIFREVRYALTEPVSEESPQDVVLSVRERPSGFVGFGGGYATDEKWRGFVELGEQNLFGTGRGLRVKSKVSGIGFRHDLYYQEPWVLNYHLTGQADLYLERSDEIGYTVRRQGVTLGVNRELAPRILLNLRYRYEFVNYSNVQPGIEATTGPLEQLNITSVIGVLDWDRRDNPILPRRGTHAMASVEVARPFLGGDTSFTKYELGGSWFVPLGTGAELAFAVRGGFTQLLLGFGPLPLSERFFLGGDTTVRGFGYKQIGPKDAAGNPLGGDIYAVGNTELRFTLHKALRGVVFLDGGELWANQENLPASGLRSSVGLGLRYETLVGPIRLDYGYKINRREGESPSRWHLTIGYPF